MIEVYSGVKNFGVSKTFLRSVIQQVLMRLRQEGNVTLTLIGDEKMKKLNRETRGKNSVTDVLSFPLTTPQFVGSQNEWGDIFICIPQIKRQAKEFGVSYKEELTRMLIHGTLHLLGYDHEKKKEAEKMFSLQEKYLREFV